MSDYKDIFANLLVKTHFVEEKDSREYDYEGDMAKSQLKSIITNAQRLHDSLDDDTNLPEWVQLKITLAEDYVVTAANYMEGELDEEYEIYEAHMTDAQMKRREKLVKSMKSADWEKRYPGRGEKVMYATATKMAMKEDLEQIDETASHFQYSGTVNDKDYELTIPRHKDLGDYSDESLHRKLRKENPHLAHHEVTAIVHSGGEEESKVDVEHEGKKYTHHVINHQEPERLYNEEVEQVDELDRKTRVSYLKKTLTQLNNIAGSRHTTGNKTYGSKTVGKRLAGLSRLERNSNHPASVRDNIDKARAQFEEVEQTDEAIRVTMANKQLPPKSKRRVAGGAPTKSDMRRDVAAAAAKEKRSMYGHKGLPMGGINALNVLMPKKMKKGQETWFVGAKKTNEEVEAVEEGAKDWKKAFGKVATKNLTKDLASVRSKVHRMDYIGLQPKVSERPVTAKDSKRLDLDALGEEVRYFSGTTVSGKAWKFTPPAEPKMLSPEFVKDRVPTLTDKEAHEVSIVAKDQYNEVDKKFAEMSEAKGTVPKTAREKDLAAKAHPKHLITHKDVLVARGVKLGEEDLREKVREKMFAGKTMTKKPADPVVFHPMGKKKQPQK